MPFQVNHQRGMSKKEIKEDNAAWEYYWKEVFAKQEKEEKEKYKENKELRQEALSLGLVKQLY